MEKLITLTVNPALDVYTTVEKLEPEKKLRCTPSTKDAGGGGVNVSRVLKRLGHDARTIYTRGGYTGEIFGELLKKENITQDPVEVKNDLRQNFAVSETSTGNIFRFGFPGAELDKDEYDTILQKLENIEGAKFLVASGSLPPGAPKDFYTRVARVAKEQGLKLIMDTSGDALCEALKEGAFLIKPNSDELEDILGKKASNKEEQKELLKEALQKFPVEAIVLSQGPDGAYLATKNGINHFPAPKVEFVSSIGAGDSMVAGIVSRLCKGKSLEDAVLYGLSCGSATIKSPGTELLKKEDVEELYKNLVERVKQES